MFCAESRVTVIVNCIVPLAAASALLAGAPFAPNGPTSLLGSRMAVNFATFGSDGLVGESSQEIPKTSTRASIATRFMGILPKKSPKS